MSNQEPDIRMRNTYDAPGKDVGTRPDRPLVAVRCSRGNYEVQFLAAGDRGESGAAQITRTSGFTFHEDLPMNDAFRSAKERRAEVVTTVQTRTGIDEAMIEKLMRGFYARVRKDPLLGPVFDARIANWEHHLQKMFAFWSSLTLQSGRYHGQPMVKHLPLPIDAEHFDRWLALFEETARDLCPPKAAQLFIDRAHRVAESLELGIAGAHDVMLSKGERYRRSA